MFIGHFAVGFGLKRAAPGLSLGTLFAAVLLPDLIWPILLLLGIEHVRIDPGNTPVTPLDFYDYPWTHSLGAAFLTALLAGLGWGAFRKSRREAAVLGLAVFSHWLLDAVVHRPDLPLWFTGGAKVGLGLWYSAGWTVAVEGFLFMLGFLLYLASTRALTPRGNVVLWSFVAIALIVYALNILGPPPPGAGAIAIAGNASWLFVFLGWWADRGRVPRRPPAPA